MEEKDAEAYADLLRKLDADEGNNVLRETEQSLERIVIELRKRSASRGDAFNRNNNEAISNMNERRKAYAERERERQYQSYQNSGGYNSGSSGYITVPKQDVYVLPGAH